MPEKTQKQYNYLLFPTASAQEPLVFTVPTTAPKPGSIAGALAGEAGFVSDSYETLFHWALGHFLEQAGNAKTIQCADVRLFSSAVKQPHRPSEKAVHVKAFRGSKDGYLFFLPTGILWGFKKPLLWIGMDKVVGVAYASVLQRTFNLVVEMEATATGSEEEGTEELEFQMIDQEDYSNIDAYVKRYGLQDKSLAEQRKAKRLGINKVKGENGDVDDGAGEGELAKAMMEDDADREQRLQDEEDEEEEDYEPGSEGESEGEGSSTDDDGDDGGNSEPDDGDDDDDDDDGPTDSAHA